MPNSLTISTQLAYAKNSGFMPAFDAAARQTGIDRNLLLAIASRESNMGLALDANWLGDNGNGIGIMQVDRRWHPTYAARYNPQDTTANVRKGAQVLQDYLARFNGNRRYAVAAYNSGPGNVSKALAQGLDPDTYTTGKDYSKDVLQRYDIIRGMGGRKKVKSDSNGAKVIIREKPEDEASRLIIISGTTLLSSLLITTYIIVQRMND
jgi:soluble lytic murein transglycosylase-like protein